MAGRSSVFSDPRVIARSHDFVCAADEVWRLQRGDDPECRFFQQMVAGEPGALRGSHQGIYIVAPDGRLLARRNALRADAVLALLDEGERAWSARRDEAWEPPVEVSYRARHRWEHSYPNDGLVLAFTLRDRLPVTESTSRPSDAATSAGESDADRWDPARRGRFNRDHAWFAADEVRNLVPTGVDLGESFDLPPTIVRRLARFHLVDNARGQVGPFADEEILAAKATATVIGIAGDRIHLRVDGHTHADSDGVWKMGDNDWKKFPSRPRTMRTEFEAIATFDLAAQRFTVFEGVAHGESTGGVGLNGRRGPDARGTILYHFELAPPGPRHRIAPAFIDVYDAEWVESPSPATQ